MKKYYKISGLVYGNFWGGGEGAYKAEEYEGDDLDKLMKQIEKDLASGTLDSGMGYQSLIGAVLEIKTIETINRNGKEYHNTECSIDYIGNLTEKDEDFLRDILLYE